MICSKCNTNETNGKQRWCTECKREYDKQYYQDPANKQKHREAKQRNKTKFSAWYHSLKDSPCVDCGNKFHPAAMQWDHRPGTIKTGDVANLAHRGNKKLVLAEIEKCDLVCANCHAVRTYDRLASVV